MKRTNLNFKRASIAYAADNYDGPEWVKESVLAEAELKDLTKDLVNFLLYGADVNKEALKNWISAEKHNEHFGRDKNKALNDNDYLMPEFIALFNNEDEANEVREALRKIWELSFKVKGCKWHCRADWAINFQLASIMKSKKYQKKYAA